MSANKSIAKDIVSLGITRYINIVFRSLIRKALKNVETYMLLYVLKIIQNTAILDREVANDYILARESKSSIVEDFKTQIIVSVVEKIFA